ncbi:MAG: DoxX family protein [Bacteroidetes bacterium]|nr:DoxX family protein [Bacteroidota bacterium]
MHLPPYIHSYHGWAGQELAFLTVSILCAFFISITFIQSGLDKLTDRKGNISWMSKQFEKTFFKSMIPVLVPFIMLLELFSGGISVFGSAWCFWYHDEFYLKVGLVCCALTLLMLLTGQRISKEYGGAVSLTGYFLIVMIGLLAVGSI